MVRPWFEPKEIGFGATPSTWEGWLATLLFVLLAMATSSFADPRPDGLAAMLGLRDLAPFRTLVFPLPAVIALILAESVAFTLLARWKSSGPWLRR